MPSFTTSEQATVLEERSITRGKGKKSLIGTEIAPETCAHMRRLLRGVACPSQKRVTPVIRVSWRDEVSSRPAPIGVGAWGDGPVFEEDWLMIIF